MSGGGRATPERAYRMVIDGIGSPEPRPELVKLARSGVLTGAMPEIEPLIQLTGSWEHTLNVIERVQPATPLMRWVALLHDIAKPQTMSVDEWGYTHYIDHEDVGAPLAEACVLRVVGDAAFAAHVARLVRLHMRPVHYTPDWSLSAVRRFLRDAGDDWELVLAHAVADATDTTGHDPERVVPERTRAYLAHLRQRCEALLFEGVSGVTALEPLLDGHDLMGLTGRPPGPWIKAVKERLVRALEAGDIPRDAPDRKELETAAVRTWLERGEL